MSCILSCLEHFALVVILVPFFRTAKRYSCIHFQANCISKLLADSSGFFLKNLTCVFPKQNGGLLHRSQPAFLFTPFLLESINDEPDNFVYGVHTGNLTMLDAQGIKQCLSLKFHQETHKRREVSTVGFF